MLKFVRGVFLAVFVSCFLFASPARAADNATAIVKTFYEALENTMRQGPILGFKGRYDRLSPVIVKTFDLSLMTRYAAGTAWAKLEDVQKKKLEIAFKRFSISTYASRFSKYSGETFEVVGEKNGPNGTMVETRLTPKGEEPVVLNYLVRKDKKGALRIADVYLAASISELATRRSEFSAILRREGVDALIASLNQKSALMETPK